MTIGGQAVIDNIISSILWIALGFGISRLYEYLRFRHPGRRIWKIPNLRDEIQVVVTSLEPHATGEYSRPSTGLGEMRAVAYIRQSLAVTYKRKIVEPNVTFSSGFSPSSLRHPLISVGGGRHNEITRRLSEHFSFPYEVIKDQSYVIVEKATGQRFQAKTAGDSVLRDFGLITRVWNPYNSQTVVFILRGIHTYGVAAAGRMFTNEYIHELAKTIKGLGEFWQVLIEIECVDNEVFPKIVGARSINKPSSATTLQRDAD